MHYEDLIGVPFKYGGRDKSGMDCYGLIIELLTRRGISPQDYGWSDESTAIQTMMLGALQSNWEKVNFQPHSVLLFKVGRFVRHVGYAIEGAKFLHCWERSNGVVVERFNQDWNKRLVGCYVYHS